MSLAQWLELVDRETAGKLAGRAAKPRRVEIPKRKGRSSNDRRCQVEGLERRCLLSASPVVLAIDRTLPNGSSTGSASVSYTVTFSEAVIGVDASDFVVVTSGGVSSSTLLGVTPLSASVYKVNVYGISGTGILGLNLVDNDSIRDGAGNVLVQPNAPASFRAQQTFAVGKAPFAVAVSDVNGDGRPDLVVANFSSNTVSVLLGNGNGTFQTQQTFVTAGSGPFSLAVSDINSDGKPDLVVTNSNNNTVRVLLGNGDGTFQSNQAFATGMDPVSVAASDVNGDGKPDLIVANLADYTVSVLLGNGNGTFQAHQTFATGKDPGSLAVSDVNGDGMPDLVVANQTDNNVSVLLGNGNGTFQVQRTFATGAFPNSVSVSDVNGDGRPDLVVANDTKPGTVSVLLGNGNGTFQAQQTFGAGTYPRSVAVSELNGDGKPDLVVTNYGSNTASVLLGNGNGTFQAQLTFATGTNPISVAVSELNGDGRPDLVVANAVDDTVSVLPGNGNGDFTGQTYTILAPDLTATLGGKLPSSLVAGKKARFAATITFTNVSTQTLAEMVGETLYLSTGTRFDPTAIAVPQSKTKKLKLKHGKHAMLKVHFAGLPESVRAGTYHLLVNVTEPGGVTAFGVSAATVTVTH